MLKKLTAILIAICLLLITPLFELSGLAAEINKGVIIIESVEGITGDSVIVPIRFEQNPGITAITVSIDYNPDALDYVGYYKGDIVNDYTVVAHPDKKHIRFISCENTKDEDKTNDGTFLKFKFNIKENAEAAFHEININYNPGDFCNSNLDKICPTVISGGVNVKFNGSNCNHRKYGAWKTIIEPTCQEKGVEERTCQTCAHKELRDIKAAKHIYSDVWTVTTPATPNEKGVMVRYCKNCTAYTDKIYFSLDDSKENDIKNEEDSEIEKNDFIKENLPEEEEKDDPENPDDKPGTDSGKVETDNPKEEAPKGDEPQSKTEIGAEESEITLSDILAKIREVFPAVDTLINILKPAFLIFTFILLL